MGFTLWQYSGSSVCTCDSAKSTSLVLPGRQYRLCCSTPERWEMPPLATPLGSPVLNSSSLDSWVSHVLGLDEGVEFFGGDVAEFEGGFAEADVGVVGGFGDLSGLVVTDFRNERGDKHERVVDVMLDLFGVGFDANDAVFDEAVAGVGEEFDGVEIVENHDGLENVQLEIALGAGEADGGVIAHHLHGDHGEGFGLRGIHLAGHDGGARLVFRKREFAEAAARAGSEPANVVGDFHERGGESL